MALSTPRPWSPDEDSLLKEAVAHYGDEPGMWKTIALHVPGRTNKACRKRWLHSLSPTVKKTPWTPDEDATLLRLYSTHSPPRWSLIAKHIPGRTDDACSKRYREALDPQLKRDEWTPDEDARLVDLTHQLGSKWTQVGQAMGRSGLGCRNRWRLLERKQRPRNASRPSLPTTSSSIPFNSIYSLSHESSPITHCLPHQAPAFSAACSPPRDSSFADESDTPHPSTSFDQSIQDSDLSRAFLSHPPPGRISTSSSLSGALTSAFHTPRLPSPPHASPNPDPTPDPVYNDISNDVIPIHHPAPPPAATPIAQSRSLSPEVPSSQSSPRVTSALTRLSPHPEPAPHTHGQDDPEPSPKPRKRPRLRSVPSLAQDCPRLSSHLPATTDRTILPYACGHAECWPTNIARFATASELGEHRRLAHPAPDDGKLFRCALHGCGKGWKNINGIQYHLQVSKAHFQAALNQTRALSDADASARDSQTQRKEYRCPHAGCTNMYKQRTGLQYHLAHGHPANVAQLEVLPPGLLRKFAGSASTPADKQ